MMQVATTTHASARDTVSSVDNKIWIGKAPFTLEVIQDFIREAERMRKAHPEALVSILMGARNRSTPEVFGKDFPIDHAWFADDGAQSLALAMAPTFYKLKINSLGNHGYIPLQRDDAVDALDCDMESHREILRLVLEGIF